MATIITTQMTGEAREGTTEVAGTQVRHVMSRPHSMFFFITYSLSTKYLFGFRTTVVITNGHHQMPSAAAATGA